MTTRSTDPLYADWVVVPGGFLHRGTPMEEVAAVFDRHRDLQVDVEWFRKEAPRTDVYVPTYRIARTAVTHAQWSHFTADTGRRSPTGEPDHPVTGVPWAEATAYCAWLGHQLDRPVRLPTENEWERAARGDDTREYPWGDEFDPRLANLREHGAGGPLPVGSFPAGASPFGVLDLAGNCDEWTSTEYARYPGAPAGVPVTDTYATDPHVTRGGAWFHCRDLARCSRRHGAYDPDLVGIGFRLASSV
ncbi:SUMF1/EgtB/PvdO family nonheme iron enzyme [Actinopolymorpha sp. B17G11]|uniref:formylglycine-generating enzyme family protein n=1 Tax=Actinopolymorpha sp. B17G11 TaxID=3160861 RepID=UPI0032E5143C